MFPGRQSALYKNGLNAAFPHALYKKWGIPGKTNVSTVNTVSTVNGRIWKLVFMLV